MTSAHAIADAVATSPLTSRPGASVLIVADGQWEVVAHPAVNADVLAGTLTNVAFELAGAFVEPVAA